MVPFRLCRASHRISSFHRRFNYQLAGDSEMQLKRFRPATATQGPDRHWNSAKRAGTVAVFHVRLRPAPTVTCPCIRGYVLETVGRFEPAPRHVAESTKGDDDVRPSYHQPATLALHAGYRADPQPTSSRCRSIRRPPTSSPRPKMRRTCSACPSSAISTRGS